MFIVGASLAQEVNPPLVIRDSFCNEANPCNIDNAHCNIVGQCQCNFAYIPTAGVDHTYCGPAGCQIEDTCEYFYGPNTYCDHRTNTCECLPSCKINIKTQQCVRGTF